MFIAFKRYGVADPYFVCWQTAGKFRVKCAETATLLKSGARSRRTIARGVGFIIWQTYVWYPSRLQE